MKKSQFNIMAILILTIGLASCSKCYECSYEVEVGNDTETVSEDFCTASSDELKEKEEEGYTCSSKS